MVDTHLHINTTGIRNGLYSSGFESVHSPLSMLGVCKSSKQYFWSEQCKSVPSAAHETQSLCWVLRLPAAKSCCSAFCCSGTLSVPFQTLGVWGLCLLLAFCGPSPWSPKHWGPVGGFPLLSRSCRPGSRAACEAQIASSLFWEKNGHWLVAPGLTTPHSIQPYPPKPCWCPFSEQQQPRGQAEVSSSLDRQRPTEESPQAPVGCAPRSPSFPGILVSLIVTVLAARWCFPMRFL